MDIVNRIRSFMETTGIDSTQFADACGIPRPTFSQILSGRNKKISDEVIAKIHAAFPELSVMWLLFGEGNMMAQPNIQISEPQQGPREINFDGPEASSPRESFPGEESIFGHEEAPQEPLIFDDDATPATPVSGQGKSAPTVTIPADGSKNIVNIMVFYSDNSYQMFVPR